MRCVTVHYISAIQELHDVSSKISNVNVGHSGAYYRRRVAYFSRRLQVVVRLSAYGVRVSFEAVRAAFGADRVFQ